MSKHQKHPDPPLHRTAAILCSDGLLLLCALFGTVFSFTSAFHLDVLPLPLLIVCLIAALFSLAIFSLPKGRHCLIALAVLLPIAGYVVWKLWETLSLGEISIRCALVNRFAQDFPVIQTIYPIAKLSDSAWMLAATLFIAALSTALALLLGWAVARVRSFWLVFWFTFPFLVPPLCITETPDWFPLMALLAVWFAMLLSSLAAKRDAAGGARLTLIALTVTGALLFGLTLALPQDGYRQPRWAARAQIQLMDWGNEIGQVLSLSGGLLPGPFSGFTASGGSEHIDLSAAGPLHYSGRTMLKVETEVQGKLYLRGYSAGAYNGTGWNPFPDSLYDEPSYKAMAGLEPLNMPALTDPDSPFYPISIEIVSAPGGCVYTPYQLVTTPDQIRGAQFYQDAYLARDNNVRRHTVYFKPEAISSGILTPLTGEAKERELSYRAFVDEHYTGVPNHAEETLLQFLNSAQRPDFVFEVDDKMPPELQNVEQLRLYLYQILNDATEYDPNTPVTPEGEDFLGYFLNEGKRGYCMHYATAATLFYRMAGYPARYVSGYVTSVPPSGKVNVPDSSAHAWTEVYINGYGWYPIDLTPGYEGGTLPWETEQAAPTPTPTAAATATPKPSQNAQASAAPTPTPTPKAGASDGVGSGPLWWVVLLVLLLILLAIPLRRMLLRRNRQRRLTSGDTNQAVIDAYVYLGCLLRWGGTISPEVEALAQKAKFSQHKLTVEEQQVVLNYVHGEAARVDGSLPFNKRMAFRWIFGLY